VGVGVVVLVVVLAVVPNFANFASNHLVDQQVYRSRSQIQPLGFLF